MNGQWWNQQMPTGLPQVWNPMSMYGGGVQTSPQGMTGYGRNLGQYTRQPWYEKYKRTPFDWSGQRAMNSPSYRGMYGTPATASAPAATGPATAMPFFNFGGSNAMLAPGFGPANPGMTAATKPPAAPASAQNWNLYGFNAPLGMSSQEFVNKYGFAPL